MKKQLLLLVMILLPMVASADAVEIDGIYYNLISKAKTAEVTSNPNYYKESVTIPPSVTYENVTYDVTSIGKSAFNNCSSLTSVNIPNSVISIGNKAFYGCTGLTSVIIPNSVTSIGDHAFYGCSGLTSITIPNSVTDIGYQAFCGCKGLTSVTIPNSVTSIGGYAFYNCTGLTSVTIPNSVTSIGDYAFYQCYGLTSVTIGNSVTSIGQSAFYGCSGLTAVHISDLESWCKISFDASDSNPLYYAHHLFMDGSEITQLEIPNGVTSIGNYAFYKCTDFTSVTIPISVTSIGVRAFSGCSGLTTITIPNSITKIGNYALANCSKLKSLYIGSGVISIQKGAISSCAELADVYCYAESVPSTQSNAFEDSYIDYATLHVPDASVASYTQTAPWSGFKSVVGLNGSLPAKCATPTITIDNGKLTFKCVTEGVKFKASYNYTGANKDVESEELILSGITTCHVSVYATKDGCLDSDVATADVEIAWGKKGDVNQDGMVSISDAVGVVNIILNEGK